MRWMYAFRRTIHICSWYTRIHRPICLVNTSSVDILSSMKPKPLENNNNLSCVGSFEMNWWLSTSNADGLLYFLCVLLSLQFERAIHSVCSRINASISRIIRMPSRYFLCLGPQIGVAHIHHCVDDFLFPKFRISSLK